eukprot:scaffold38562_cov63-Phaeocystis_antarctica.AAC.1
MTKAPSRTCQNRHQETSRARSITSSTKRRLRGNISYPRGSASMPAKRLGSTLRSHGTMRENLTDLLPRSEVGIPADKMAAVAVTSGPIAFALSAFSTEVAALTSAPAAEPVNFDVDEWDPQRGAFWQHAVAGSAAGLAEHSVMFPVDTMKTHMQVNAATRASLLEMVQAQGVPRMWRGVQTMLTGCIPAHAAYFSIFEAPLTLTLTPNPNPNRNPNRNPNPNPNSNPNPNQALKPRLTHAAMGLYNPPSAYSPPGSSGVVSGRVDSESGFLAVGPHDTPPVPTSGNSEMAAALGSGAAVMLATVAPPARKWPLPSATAAAPQSARSSGLLCRLRARLRTPGSTPPRPPSSPRGSPCSPR